MADNKNNNKKYLAIVVQYKAIDSIKTTYGFVLKKLSESFDQIYFINCEKLELFHKKHNHDLSYIKKSIPNNFILFEPQSTKDFSDFLKDKNILVVNTFGRYFQSFKILYLLKKFNIKQVQINNVGQNNWSQITNLKNPIKTITYKTGKLTQRISLILANLGLLQKVDIRFVSNRVFLKNIKKNRIKNFLYKNNFFFAKELIEVNSMASDILNNEKPSITEDYIVHLDASLNYYHETELRGMLPQEEIEKHYFYLNKFLKNLSKTFQKEIKVCIHPMYDLSEHQKNLPDFEIIKFKTRDYIYKAFLVTHFDSSAIVDAVLLRKKIIGIISDAMTKNEQEHSKAYSDLIGYMKLNSKENKFDKTSLLIQLNKNVTNYEHYINNYLQFNKNSLGIQKIINTIKERYF